MKYFIPIEDINANGFILRRDIKYPIISEYDDLYYIKNMGIKLGFDKACENEMYRIVEE